jgi:hypothetical protein
LLSEQNDDSAIPGNPISPFPCLLCTTLRILPVCCCSAADLLRTIYSTAVKFGGEKEYNTVLSIYKKPPTPQHQLAALSSLTATRDEVLLQRTFDLVLSGEVREQDVTAPISVSWDFFNRIFCSRPRFLMF